MTVGDADRDSKLVRGAVAVAVGRVHDHVEGPVDRVAACLDGARHVLDAHHRSAHDRAQIVLDAGVPEATTIGVDEPELQRIVRVDLDLDRDDLIPHRGERADQRKARDVIVGGELVDGDGGGRVRFLLHDLERDIPGDAAPVSCRTLRDEKLTAFAGEMTVPRGVAPREPGARLRGGAGVRGANGLLVLAARAPDAAPPERAPRRRHRRGVDGEPAP